MLDPGMTLRRSRATSEGGQRWKVRWLWLGAALFFAVTALLPLAVTRAGGTRADRLLDAFQNPPPSARMRCYWWWLNGNTDEATITRDLEAMKAKGYGGALLVDANGSEQRGNREVPAGPMFGTPRWRELYRHALREAARLGLEISLNIESGWNLGGPMVEPKQAAKLLTFSRVAVKGPAAFYRRLPEPPQRNGFYRDIAVLAYPLRHGAPLAGSPGAGQARRPIRTLRLKAAFEESGFSAPLGAPLLEDDPAEAGEQDALVAEVRDLTGSLHPDGTLRWQVPEGQWEILRAGYTSSDARTSTSSGRWQGLAIDYLDRGAFESYWRQVVAPLLDDARPYIGKSLRYLVTDSWELGGVNWTPKFREEFRARRGYDPLPYLPIAAGRILQDRETSNRFLNDLRRTVGDLVIAEHYAVFTELAARAGLATHPESGGPHGAPIDALETLAAATFPQTEFWARSATHRVRDDERFFVKEAASVAHVYGRTLVAAEGPTSIGPHWDESIWDNLKPSFDQAVCAGLNLLFWHTFTSSPAAMGLPGQEYFAGTHLNPNVTWWRDADALVGYINRTQSLLQQGLPVSDVVYYYGDNVPNFVQYKGADPARVLPGYDYDVADENALVHRMAVRDGRIVLPDGVSYRLLVLPDRAAMSLDAAWAVARLVHDGATVLGPKPRCTTGLGDDTELRAIADTVWGACDGSTLAQHAYGKGMVYCGQASRAVLAKLGVAPDFDFRVAPGAGPLDYIHRVADGADIYFVRNTRPAAVYAEVMFRVAGRAPELWHPDTGETEVETIYDFTAGGRTRMPLWLEPNGSVLVVFRAPAATRIVRVFKDGRPVFPVVAGNSALPELRVRRDAAGGFKLYTEAAGHYRLTTPDGHNVEVTVAAGESVRPLDGAWTVAFPPGWGAPASVNFPRLESWTANTDPGIRYFSGTATYRKRISIAPGQLRAGVPLYLDLGDVHELARVRLNGIDLGILWKKPFRVEIGRAAKAGWNDLEIEVTNFWPNRLIGDQRLPAAERRTWTNITKFRADSPLLPSGLLGPVTLQPVYTAPLALPMPAAPIPSAAR